MKIILDYFRLVSVALCISLMTKFSGLDFGSKSLIIRLDLITVTISLVTGLLISFIGTLEIKTKRWIKAERVVDQKLFSAF